MDEAAAPQEKKGGRKTELEFKVGEQCLFRHLGGAAVCEILERSLSPEREGVPGTLNFTLKILRVQQPSLDGQLYVNHVFSVRKYLEGVSPDDWTIEETSPHIKP